ncbi:MAG: ABC transporter substrate-binding protein [Pseudomonadota bacterium]|jgi:peptide/nickel transport system substrate-binding protein|uniref:ABC-type dipeptide transport system, periplasmic component n=1 Tax=Caballeronia sordidicola TaxID=196367 RepID=A0A242MJF9_CABSO|nr:MULTISPECIES: ABC transporter substrate-binding protein [Burkholderiaceae]AMM13210.1 peptide ABC transporter substrate-binding protein [Burkholderia sp. PAMC 28687]MDP9158412.1 ABC transporter substrate-binding protein [Pseudomonadota bacterium]OTP71364.1 ABC-type dipeptide transport system, periplasmic component [Caballeronia sordidicola]
MKKTVTTPFFSDSTLDAARNSTGELGNHAIDEFKAGRLSRRELLRHASLLGLSTAALAAGGLLGMPSARAQAPAGKPGATIRVAHLTPSGQVDPLTVTDPAGLALINQTGEFLIDDDGQALVLRPSLALSWKPNAKGDVWTFKLRPNVKFHDGQPMTAKDVAATFNRLADPGSGSAALSVLKGVLSKGSVKATDDMTVEFHLDAPNGNFPYYVSSDTYNAVILPANFSGTYEKSFPGTGPFKFESYTPKVGASFVRNPDYWGEKALPERIKFSFYADEQSELLALQGRQADVMGDFTVQGGLSMMTNPEFKVLGVKSSAHRQMHMRTDTGPFKDKRVRQALALAVNREVIVKGLFKGHAALGNDSPFSPVFPSSDLSVPQRKMDLAKAKQLLAAAGVPNGFDVTLTTEKYMEIPDLAVVIQNAAKAIGIKITLKVESQELYYGAGTYGKSDWLDSPLGITDYGHRGVPNVFLNAPLTSEGTWNAAHFKNPQYDKLVADFVAALDVASQKKLSGQIQTLLLDETPVVIPYFYDQLIVTRANVKGVRFNAISQLYFERATIGA